MEQRQSQLRLTGESIETGASEAAALNGITAVPLPISEPSLEVNPLASVKIDVRKVDFFYGAKQALYDVSLPMRERQVTALIGPSGCGKSTFLRTLNRMNDLIPGTRTVGEAIFDGENIYD